MKGEGFGRVRHEVDLKRGGRKACRRPIYWISLFTQ